MDEGAPRPGDYERIARAIAFIAERVGEQPTLEAVAAHVHLSPFHFSGCFAAGPAPAPGVSCRCSRSSRPGPAGSFHSLLEVSEELG